MDSKSLMIGDWYQWYADGKYYQFQVEPDDFTKDHVANFEPIPLTAEILEKNGYKKSHYEFNGEIEEPYEIITAGWRSSYNFDYGWGYAISKEYTFGGKITYVHELQHALRLCGLNELAEKFKI